MIAELYKIGAVKQGSFTLKSGVTSSFYIDLRLLISYPDLMKKITALFWEKIKELKFDLICGVPYTALPLATALSITYDIPMILRRKEAKDYGTKKMVEGVFTPGQRCLIIEDVVTSGMSVMETIEPLKNEGLIVEDVIAIINREQGGKENLSAQGLHLHQLFNLSEVLHASSL